MTFSDETLDKLKAHILSLQSCVDAFFTGDVSDNATIEEAIMAKWGRIRLETLAKERGE